MDQTLAIALALLLAGVLVVTWWAERRARRRRARAWLAHVRGGGLIRALIARWHRVPRLTDRRDRP